MEFFELHDRRYARFDRLGREADLVHAFSTRPQDVSARRDSRQAERAATRARMARDLGLNPENLCYCVQAHDTRLAIIETIRQGGPFEDIDALATALPSTPLMTFSADCPLVLAYDPTRHALGMVHASWRCTVAEATHRLIQVMCQKLGCRAANILAGIGPSAGPCCYQVKDDVFEAAAELPDRDQFFAHRDGRMFFDLWQANRAQLMLAGVLPEHIETAGICTMCRTDTFFSFRREGPGCGHFGLMAGLREAT